MNSTTLYALATARDVKKLDSFKVGWELVMHLALPQIQIRSRDGLSASLTASMDSFLGVTSGIRESTTPSTPSPSKGHHPRKCAMCKKESYGEGYAAKVKGKLSSIMTQCQRCEVACCNKHYILECFDCNRK